MSQLDQTGAVRGRTVSGEGHQTLSGECLACRKTSSSQLVPSQFHKLSVSSLLVAMAERRQIRSGICIAIVRNCWNRLSSSHEPVVSCFAHKGLFEKCLQTCSHKAGPTHQSCSQSQTRKATPVLAQPAFTVAVTVPNGAAAATCTPEPPHFLMP